MRNLKLEVIQAIASGAKATKELQTNFSADVEILLNAVAIVQNADNKKCIAGEVWQAFNDLREAEFVVFLAGQLYGFDEDGKVNEGTTITGMNLVGKIIQTAKRTKVRRPE